MSPKCLQWCVLLLLSFLNTWNSRTPAFTHSLSGVLNKSEDILSGLVFCFKTLSRFVRKNWITSQSDLITVGFDLMIFWNRALSFQVTHWIHEHPEHHVLYVSSQRFSWDFFTQPGASFSKTGANLQPSPVKWALSSPSPLNVVLTFNLCDEMLTPQTIPTTWRKDKRFGFETDRGVTVWRLMIINTGVNLLTTLTNWLNTSVSLLYYLLRILINLHDKLAETVEGLISNWVSQLITPLFLSELREIKPINKQNSLQLSVIS